MQRQTLRFLSVLLLACGWGGAQNNKGQQPSQQNSGGPQVSIPAQLYPLNEVPTTRQDAEANLKQNRFWDKSKPKYVWYRVAASTSTAIPVVLVPMRCIDRPAGWSGDKDNFDADFEAACRAAGERGDFVTPSQPMQNKNPLKLSDGLILAIRDEENLLNKLHVSALGLTIQSANGTPLNTDPVRPVVWSSGGSGGGSQGGGGGQGANGNPLAEVINPGIFQTCDNPPCISISPDHESALVRHPFPGPLRLKALDQDRKPLPHVHIRVDLPVPEPTARFEEANSAVVFVETDTNGIATLPPLIAGYQAGRPYNITAFCVDEKRNPCVDRDGHPVGTEGSARLTNLARVDTGYYYIPWANNPLLGDTILSVSITAQAPAPVPVTLRADANRGCMSFATGGTIPVSHPPRRFPPGPR